MNHNRVGWRIAGFGDSFRNPGAITTNGFTLFDPGGLWFLAWKLGSGIHLAVAKGTVTPFRYNKDAAGLPSSFSLPVYGCIFCSFESLYAFAEGYAL